MEIKKTITTIFMVPTLKIPKDALKENSFINGFIKDDKKDVEYKDSIYLLFKPVDLYKFRKFLDSEYERTKDIIDDYDYPEGYVVVVYKLNDKFNDDFQLIRRGKYSKTSQEFQNSFSKVVKIIIDGKHRDELSLQIRIFKKTQDLIDFWEESLSITFSDEYECWEGFDQERETLNIDNIEHYVQ